LSAAAVPFQPTHLKYVIGTSLLLVPRSLPFSGKLQMNSCLIAKVTITSPEWLIRVC
jgi:hypothetical protein